MAKRKDQNQVLEQYSRGRLLTLLAEWVVNSLTEEDYAFDFEIRPTAEFSSPPTVSPTPFYGQLKASHRFDDPEFVWYDFDVDFLADDCLRASVPVVLFIYERRTDQLNWCVAQDYCWDHLDAERPGWRDQSTVRVKLRRYPLTDIHARSRLRSAIERVRRRITLRDYVATARHQPFDHPPGTNLPIAEQVTEYKQQLVDEATALVDSGSVDAALAKFLEVYKLPEVDEPTLDSIHSLLALRETDDPSVTFSKIRFATDGLQLAEAQDPDDMVDGLRSELDAAWEFVDEQFVGATYFHREAGLELLILDVPWRRLPVGGANVLAEFQWSDGELDTKSAHAIAANEEYELVERGEARNPRDGACAEREHDFDREVLRTAPGLSLCSACGLSRRTIEEWLGQDVPDVCDRCESVSHDIVFHTDTESFEDIGLCPECRRS